MYRFLLFSFVCGINFGFFVQTSWAKDVPPPVPVGAVKAESLAPPPGQKASASTAPKYPIARPLSFSTSKSEAIPRPSKKPQRNDVASFFVPSVSQDQIIVLELFSTQACPFCPKADALMAKFVDQPDLIALSCHVDYFDVKHGSFALPICSSRQIAYEGVLGLPKYTPQIVLNGGHDVVGYKQSDVRKIMKSAQKTAPQRLKIKLAKEGSFSVQLPHMDKGRYKIWLLAYDKVREVNVQDGANAGKAMTYYNVVSRSQYLGPWGGQKNNISFDADMGSATKGFVVLVQEEISSRIVLAGKLVK